MRHYLAYGSNLSVEQMACRCPDAKVVGTAVIEGWRLRYRYHATIEPDPNASVPVLVWEVSDEDERELDLYEGFPRYYVKRDFTVRVTALDGGDLGELEAMAYLMAEGRSEIHPPAEDYHAVLEEGYAMLLFDRGGLDRALEESLRAVDGHLDAHDDK